MCSFREEFASAYEPTDSQHVIQEAPRNYIPSELKTKNTVREAVRPSSRVTICPLITYCLNVICTMTTCTSINYVLLECTFLTYRPFRLLRPLKHLKTLQDAQVP